MSAPANPQQDADAIVQTIRQPLLVLDGELRVQSANPAFYDRFGGSSEETEGRLIYELGDGQWDIPHLRERLENVLPENESFADYEVEHNFPDLGQRVMLLNARAIRRTGQADLILLAIEDVTELKRREEELQAQREFAEKIVDAVREPLLVMDWDLRVKSANESFYGTFQVARDETEGRLVYELGNGQWDIPRLRELLEDVLPQNNAFDDYEVEHDFPELGRRVMLLNARRVDHVKLILLAIEDVTERRAADRRRRFVVELGDAVRDLDEPDEIARRVTIAVAEHLGVSQAAFATVDEDARQARVLHSFRQEDAGEHGECPLDDFGPHVLEELRTGRTLVAFNVEHDPRTADHAQAFAAVGARAAVCVPVVKGGRLRAVFAVTHRERRNWSDQDVALVEQLAERTRSAVERAEALLEVRQGEARLWSAFQIDTVGVIFWNSDMRICETNEAFLRMTGFRREQVRGLTWQELTPEGFHPASERAVAELKTVGEVTPYEKQYFRQDGSRWWGLFTARKLDSDADEAVEFVLDVTERRQSEEALRESEERLRRLNDALEDRVAERTAELRERERRLRALAMELTQAEQQERARLACILHDDVQQLLVASQMRLGLLGDEPLSDHAREELRTVEALLRQSQQSLRSLSVELAPPVLHERGLGPGLKWLAKRMQDHHNLEIQVDTDPAAEAVVELLRDLLFQCARELLLNVVKHAGADRARVHLGRQGDQVRLEVCDTGRGFDPAAAEQAAGPSFGLFHIGERLRHVGGEMVIESVPCEGTRVTLAAPIVEPARKRDAALAGVSGESTAALDRVRVLLVDDHQTVREGLARLLERKPELEVVGQAGAGREAVALARKLRPDVVVMDVNMPGMSGIEATRRIKSELPGVRVIGLSLYAEEDMAQALLDAGAERYLTKDGPSANLTAAILSAQE